MEQWIIDVSKYQGNINWDQVKAAGVQGAVLRAGYGRYADQVDRTFARNYAECKRLGIPVGAYWYIYANTLVHHQAEMELFLRVLEARQLELPVYIDVEDKAQATMSPADLTNMLRQGLGMLETAGWFAAVYTYTSFASHFDYQGLAATNSMWLADYRTNYNTTLPRDMHQYTSGGTVPGISGRVDCNRCYRDFPPIIKGAGLNGFTAQSAARHCLAWPLAAHTLTAGWYYSDGSLHRAIDLRAAVGTPVYAAEDGTVTIAYSWSGVVTSGDTNSYGNMVRIDHAGGLATLYAHLDVISVNAGQAVRKGQLIGRSGNTGNSTGPHLHFEVRLQGQRQNPLCWLDDDFDTASSKVYTYRPGDGPAKKKEDKPMEWTMIEGRQLRCTSGEKPACEVFEEPAVDAKVVGRMELDEACEVLAQGATVALAGMTGIWYQIALDGAEVYCLALPDRCVLEDKPVPEPAPEPVPEPEQPADLQAAVSELRAALAGLPEGRAKSLAVTKLDECEMWAAQAGV